MGGPRDSGVFSPESGDRVLLEPRSDGPSVPPAPRPLVCHEHVPGTPDAALAEPGSSVSLLVLPAWWDFLFRARLLLPVTVPTGDPTSDLGLDPGEKQRAVASGPAASGAEAAWTGRTA